MPFDELPARLGAALGQFETLPARRQAAIVKEPMRGTAWLALFGISEPRATFCGDVGMRVARRGIPLRDPVHPLASILSHMAVDEHALYREVGRIRASAEWFDEPMRPRMAARLCHYWHGSIMSPLIELAHLVYFDGGSPDRTVRLMHGAAERMRS